MYAIISYGFPAILVVFEWGLRRVLQVDDTGFLGPTLATAGLTILAPLTRPKTLSVSVPGRDDVVVISKRDHIYVGVCWLFVLGYLFVWAGTCFASIRHPSHVTMAMPTHFLVGIAAYVLSLVMVAIKEWV